MINAWADLANTLRDVSEKHKAERDLLRAALVGLVGADTREELEQMEAVIRSAPAPWMDKAATVDAIHALLATMEQPQSVAAVDPIASDPGTLSTREKELESELSRLRQERTALVRLRESWDGQAASLRRTVEGQYRGNWAKDEILIARAQCLDDCARSLETTLGLPDPPEGGT